jgi:hypothetical protein
MLMLKDDVALLNYICCPFSQQDIWYALPGTALACCLFREVFYNCHISCDACKALLSCGMLHLLHLA